LVIALPLGAMGAIVALAFPAAYAVVVVGFALSRAPRLGAGAFRLVTILPTLHIGYGVGFLVGVGETLLGRPSPMPGVP